MAVLAPIPSAIVRIETAVKTGDFASCRRLWRRPNASLSKEAPQSQSPPHSNSSSQVTKSSAEELSNLPEVTRQLQGNSELMLSGPGYSCVRKRTFLPHGPLCRPVHGLSGPPTVRMHQAKLDDNPLGQKRA